MIQFANLDSSSTRDALNFIFEEMVNNKVVPLSDKIDISTHKIIFMESYLFKGLSRKLQFIGAYREENLIGILGYEENYLTFLFIKKEYQKEHIGTILLKKYLDILKKRKYDTVTLNSLKNAVPFYEQKGFQKEEVKDTKNVKMKRVL